MNPGETIIGLDFGGHLWVILSEIIDGEVVVTNLTTHGKASCGTHCVVIRADEHEYLRHDSCVYYRGATFNPVEPLRQAKATGALRQAAPVSATVLVRIQAGVHASRFTSARIRAAIRS